MHCEACYNVTIISCCFKTTVFTHTAQQTEKIIIKKNMEIISLCFSDLLEEEKHYFLPKQSHTHH